MYSGGALYAQSPDVVKETPPIQDNSFLVEEAYNQERAVVQHVSTFTRLWNSKDWSYSFTQEWPGLRNPRHQFSYTLVGMQSGSFAGQGAGLGDVQLNYRYQLVGSGQTRVAFAPRVSLLLPCGDVTRARGVGAAGIQTNLPLSIVRTPALSVTPTPAPRLCPEPKTPNISTLLASVTTWGKACCLSGPSPL